MPTKHPFRIAIHWMFSLSLLLGANWAQAQDSSTELVGVLQSIDESAFSGGAKAVFTEPDPIICTLERSTDDFRPFPNINKYPMRVTGAGIDFGFKGQIVHTGHTATVVFNPNRNRTTVPAFNLIVTGPNGYQSKTPVEMTPACEVSANDPAICAGTNSATQFKRTELVLPALPHAGRYAMHLDLTIKGRIHRPQNLAFQVVDHSLAQHLQLPANYAETARAESPLQIDREDKSIYNGPSLVLCGRKNRAAICIQTTQPISNCQEQIDAGLKIEQPTNVPLIDASVGVKNNKAVSNWCRNDQLFTLYTNRRWRIKTRLQELLTQGDEPQ